MSTVRTSSVVYNDNDMWSVNQSTHCFHVYTRLMIIERSLSLIPMSWIMNQILLTPTVIIRKEMSNINVRWQNFVIVNIHIHVHFTNQHPLSTMSGSWLSNSTPCPKRWWRQCLRNGDILRSPRHDLHLRSIKFPMISDRKLDD